MPQRRGHPQGVRRVLLDSHIPGHRGDDLRCAGRTGFLRCAHLVLGSCGSSELY